MMQSASHSWTVSLAWKSHRSASGGEGDGVHDLDEQRPTSPLNNAKDSPADPAAFQANLYGVTTWVPPQTEAIVAFFQVLQYARIVVLDNAEEEGGIASYLTHGSCFVEAFIAILCGVLLPSREGQFEALDEAIAGEIMQTMSDTRLADLRRRGLQGRSLRSLLSIVEERGLVIDHICNVVEHKYYDNEDDRFLWVGLTRLCLSTWQALSKSWEKASPNTVRLSRTSKGSRTSGSSGQSQSARDLTPTRVSVHSTSEKLPYITQHSGESLGSFSMDVSDILDNNVANAMVQTNMFQRPDIASRLSAFSEHSKTLGEDNFEKLGVSNFHQMDAVMQYRLHNVCSLTESLFGPLDTDLPSTDRLARSKKKARLSLTLSGQDRWRHRIRNFVEGDGFSIFFLIITAYALLTPDLCAAHGIYANEAIWLSVTNSAVFFFFVAEVLLQCAVVDQYIWSARFPVDLFATISWFGDTWWGQELVPSDAAVAGRGVRALRVMRTTRLTRLSRLARVTQVLGALPQLSRAVKGANHDLALLLVHKRLWRIYQYLDVQGEQRLDEQGQALFNMALWHEFSQREGADPRNKTLSERKSSRSSMKKARVVAGKSVRAFRNAPNVLAVAAAWRGEATNDGSFETLSRRFLQRLEGRICVKRCEEDVERVKGSCALIQATVQSVSLKVCITILLVLAVLPMLSSDPEDRKALQTLRHVDHEYLNTPLATMAGGALCDVVWDAVALSDARLLYMAVNWTTLWTSSCNCCLPENVPQGPSIDLVSIVVDMIESRQPHRAESEFQIFCEPSNRDLECDHSARSIVLLDNHRAMRKRAQRSLMFTFVVVVLIFTFVLAFSGEVNQYTTYVLHPLWNMLDDMISLKSIEVVCMSRFDPSMSLKGHGLRKDHPLIRERRRIGGSRRKSFCCCLQARPPALKNISEMRNLHFSWVNLCKALRSWARFVPPTLYQNLVVAGIEAAIGVRLCEVCVVFFDIASFSEKCRNLDPKAVLELLATVQEQVSNALDLTGGTLLECVADEALAVFNAPFAVQGYIEHAVEAAVDAQERVSAKVGIKLRVGVHSAQVLVGNIGSPNRMKYGMLGDGVNVSARLKSLNSKFSTYCLASDHTLSFEDAHEKYVTRPIGKLVLKGRKKGTTTWEVRGRRGRLPDHVQDACSKHWNGFELYLQRKFSEARVLFKAVMELLEEDGQPDPPSELLHRMCEEYMVNPPPPDWDGVMEMSSK
mmetsp:Transcript_16283/g.38300  ORF Transcript_16283/g.38300 Transcript_16283/m.38300 type:complete len:1225 (+) Transcript_16283:1-3675(+)